MSQTLEASRQHRPAFRRVDADPSDYLDDLLTFMRLGLVVPIIGPELLMVEDQQGQPVLLYDYIARLLAERFRLTDRLGDDYSLQDVVWAYSRDGRVQDIYPKIQKIFQQHRFPTPPALRKLAGISAFRLFITTTFDSLLVQAINEVRFAGEPRTQQRVYARDFMDGGDLDASWAADPAPLVFNLLGVVGATPHYVVTEEDKLEFMIQLQDDARHMRLFSALKNKHLLILGCSFPDWLARFFIRVATRTPLSAQRDGTELLADSRSPGDRNLALFLDNFSYNTRVFPRTATDFVDLLAEQWEADVARNGPPPGAPAEPVRAAPAAREMKKGAVLVSYASEDRAAAERLRAALEKVADVWMDTEDLIPGDNWERVIGRSISTCSLFVPVISRASAERSEGFFRLEWKRALHRREQMDEDRPFVVPVAIDDLPSSSTGIPDAFWASQVTRLPGGAATPEFLQAVRVLVEKVSPGSARQP